MNNIHNMNSQKDKPEKVQIKSSESPEFDFMELLSIIQGLEIAINRKVFTKEEISKIFPAWNNVASELEKYKRHVIVKKLYQEQDNISQEKSKIQDKRNNVANINVDEDI